MEKTGLWSRIGRWLRTVNGGAACGDDDRAAEAAPGLSTALVERGDGNTATPDAVEGVAGNGRRPSEAGRLHAGAVEADSLTVSVREFLDRQNDRTEKLDELFVVLTEHLARVARATDNQVDVLKEMNRRWEVETTARQSLDQKLAHLPSLADAQRETMVSISRHLEAGREALDRETAALTELRTAVDAVGDATASSTKVVEQLLDQAEDRERGTVELLHVLIKRLTVIGAVLGALVAVSAFFGLLALTR